MLENMKPSRMKVLSVMVAVASVVAACQKPEPPDLLQGQREALEKAKALEGQLQQQVEAQRQLLESQINSGAQPAAQAVPQAASQPVDASTNKP